MRRPAALAMFVSLLFGISCRSPSEPTGKWTPPPLSPLHISGLVRDTVGRPIDDATIRAGLPGGSDLVARTGADGRFALADPTPVEPRLSLQVMRDGFFPTIISAPNNNAADVLISLMPTELLGLDGQYTATLTAATSCTELPAIARIRTYAVTIQPNSARASLLATVSGADVVPGYHRFFGTVADDAVRFSIYSWDAFSGWLEDYPIFERLDTTTFVSFMGTASNDSPLTSSASVVATFNGTISYCPLLKEPTVSSYPLGCQAVPIECTSSQHRLVLTRK